MSRDIPESDWKQFKAVRAAALERFCRRTLDELARVIDSPKGTFHDHYLRAYDLLRRRDKELARAFDGSRRSTAIMQLAIMHSLGVLTDEDLSLFSEETRRSIKSGDDEVRSERSAESAGCPRRPDLI